MEAGWSARVARLKSALIVLGHFSTRQCSASNARVSHDCFRTVTTLPCSARSPNLSRIEHFWDHWGRRFGHPTSLNELEAKLQQIWNEMPQDIIQNLYALMPVEHHLYQCSRPGGSLAQGFSKQDQTLLARFRSGQIKSMKFSEGRKSFEMCTKSSSEPATPAHILECLGLTNQDLADVPLLVVYFLKVYCIMDLVQHC
ncbi:uncharacterized protein TNCV_3443201 [Trichonephila clavipes]|nr:uncharacterized protein TNCV_3443201 [Trichonephila clavipes]